MSTDDRLLAYVPDLMDRSRFPSSLGARFIQGVDDLDDLGPAVVVVVDLGRPAALDVVRAAVTAGAGVVGFASHVDADGIAAAKAAGCDRVLPRSRFFADVAAAIADVSPGG